MVAVCQFKEQGMAFTLGKRSGATTERKSAQYPGGGIGERMLENKQVVMSKCSGCLVRMNNLLPMIFGFMGLVGAFDTGR
eukprot:scaffold24525_cov162-Cylindrotheca_fusiformis.AAC.5